MTHALDSISQALKHALAAQDAATAAWHAQAPGLDPERALADRETDFAARLTELVVRQHFMNFTLWHHEDQARRTDVTDAVIADCKRAIDRCNQLRNNAMEAVDAAVVQEVRERAPAGGTRHNSESVGMIVDRLSILSLKIYHMKEQTERPGADEAHKQSCCRKLAVLREQRADLERALHELLEDFASGAKSPKVYYQFKMYNDPSLNPQLYAPGSGEAGPRSHSPGTRKSAG